MPPSSWASCTIGDIAAPVRNALVGGPFGSNLVTADYVLVGVPVIRGQNMGVGRWVGGDHAFVSPAKADALAANTARPGDLVFTQRGTLGQVAVVPKGPYDKYIVSQSQMKLTVDETRACSAFLYYVFRTAEQQEFIRQNAIQTGVPHTNLGILRNTRLCLPPVAEQRAIASILGALDDKIELNARISRTLEDMARAIFKSWFVDFDPVRAKMEGHKPSGMDDATATLFPDSFEDSDLGPIPKGWRLAELREIAHVVDCLHSKKPVREGEGRPLLQLCNIRDDGLIDMSDTYWISADDYEEWISRMEAQPGDCVITNVGRVGAVAQIPIGVRAALGRNMTGMRVKQEYPCPTFLIECLLSSWMKEEIVRKSDAGTILDALNVRSIPKLRIVLPPSEAILKEFERICRPLRAKMEASLSESHHLASIRDALLPKLISGEIRVKDVQKIVAEAV